MPLTYIWKLPIKEYNFKTDLTIMEREEIEKILKDMSSRVKLLHGIMNMLWKSYLQFIGLNESAIPENFDVVLQKGNADRLFQRNSSIRSMTFYLNKMLYQQKINDIRTISAKYLNMQITDFNAFDCFATEPKNKKPLLPAESQERTRFNTGEMYEKKVPARDLGRHPTEETKKLEPPRVRLFDLIRDTCKKIRD
jgi:hypothetical protein